MAKLCPNCTRLNSDTAGLCKHCHTTLLRAPYIEIPFFYRPLFVMGSISLLILTGILTYTFFL